MLATAHPADSGADVPPGGEWQPLYEALVLGATHSMNNVVTVLSLSLELATPPEASSDLLALRTQLTHLEKLIKLLATLSTRSARHEALEVGAAVDVALAMHTLKSTTRPLECSLRVTGVMPAVRVPPSALLRVLLLLIDSAKRNAGTTGAAVEIDLAGDTDRAVIRAPGSHVPGVDALSYAAACGGSLTVRDGYQVLELPSLQRLRASSHAVEADGPLRPTRASES